MKAPVTEAKREELKRNMAKAGVLESDLEESFTCGGGKGGQKINKTATRVELRHLPTGRVVHCQETRSLALNRFFARRRLVELLIKGSDEAMEKEQKEREKIRKKKQRARKRNRNHLEKQDKEQ